MPLINFEINIDVYWSDKCNTVATGVTNQRATFSITDTKLYVPVVTLSIQDNPKLLEQLNYGFKRKINWNKYQSKISTSRRNKYFDYWINPSFQRINIPFVLSFEGEVKRTNFKRYYVLTVEIKNYVMIDGQNFFDQPVRNNLITYGSIQKIGTGQGNDYVTCTIIISKTIMI